MTTAQEPEIIRGRFAALGYRDFRLVFLTAALSNTGNWMEIVLRNWLVYEISGSAFALGLCNLAHWLPFLILSPLAGAYVDRWDKRWVILCAQVTLTLVTLTLGLLTITGRIGLWQVVVLVLIHGVAESFDNPARQSLVSDLVGRKVVMNAVSLNSAMYYGTRLVGPAIGGLLIAASGTGIGFIINAATFLPYIFVLPFIHPRSASQGRVEQKAWKALLEGLDYIRADRAVLAILVTVGLISTFSVSYQTLMPIFAEEILRVGPQGLGLLSSAAGLGALVGALFLACYSMRLRRQGLFVCGAASLFGFSLLMFSFSRIYGFSLCCLVLAGASNVAFSSTTNAILQTSSPDDLRGRVMGAFTMTSLGTNVFGSLIMGSLGEVLGAPHGLAVAALIAVFMAAAAYAFVPEMRRLGA